MSFDRLINKIIAMKNPSVVGLDPKLEYLPTFLCESYREKYGNTLKAASEAIYAFNCTIIDQIYDKEMILVPQCRLMQLLTLEVLTSGIRK